MEQIRKQLGLALVALMTVFSVAGCELSEGVGDAGVDAAGDAGSDTGSDAAQQCVSDGFCDAACLVGTDPDCASCACDQVSGVCEVQTPGSATACSCDVDCSGALGCLDDGYCDVNCPSNGDPDCASCDCDRESGACDAGREESDDVCTCDDDCFGGGEACQADGYVDDWCLARDPDYAASVSDCDYFGDVCESNDDHSTDRCDDDPDCGASDQACSDDGHCDTFCDPANPVPPPDYDCKDPDCSERDDGTCRR